MLNLKHIIIVLLLGLAFNTANSQEIGRIVTRARIINGDTVPVFNLSPVIVVAPRIFESKREERRYNRLVNNIKVVYPYAKLAGIKFREYCQQLEKIESNAEKRRMMKRIENEIREEFEGDLRKLTISQGHILIKLIDRETQHTSYDILKEFRGIFRAVFWQSLGRIFGYDLRTNYEPWGEDIMIEHIIILIEAGAI